ncbi:MAG TPA: bifunctional DNA-formamidopyrimidine glycosylase/DNA-(apurinic or apyrimidinic site) lyase [Dehalococcoidia bacterium]|jgi:formamidopyrimidine-DNA glycosylase|nr:bifunctional DNA-formamidopyrimidine glycosylase/DNA-(apurinic or apyrimidinic site) lyase [Dehalococcoidia bacterium]
MPELPEVETIRRDLLPIVVGREIIEAWVSPNAPRLIQLLPPDEFCRQMAGRRIEDIDRRGKYLLFRLDEGLLWGVHLRMTGRLLHDTNACPQTPYLRATFHLDNGAWLCFVDLRKFGTMWLVDDESLVTGRLGPEPLSEDFTPAYLQALLKRRSAPVKAALIDQGAIAGIGNIYADEALFIAGISPKRAGNSLSKPRVARLHAAIREALELALGDRGSSFRDYLDPSGREGGHHLKVKVFRRTGLPCYVCGTEIKRIKLGGRSTHFCPKCQR